MNRKENNPAQQFDKPPESAPPAIAASSSDASWKSFSGSKARGPLGKVLALPDFETLARKKLPKAIFGYISGAAETNSSYLNNHSSFNNYSFVPRVLCNVAGRDSSTELFGQTYAAPFGIAPMGVAALSCYQGDLAMAKAAAKANIAYVLSGTSLTPLETIAQAAPRSWFQAYLPGTPEKIDNLIDRVARAHYKTLVITVDVPVAGNRENILRSGFSTPLRPSLGLALDGLSHPSWLIGTFVRTLINGLPHFENSYAQRGAPIISQTIDRDFSARDHFDWSHVKRIRQRWQGNLILKGILSVPDAVLAREHGADAIVLSNHGGRQLDGAIAPLHVLQEVVTQVGTMPVLIDGGILRGTDVLKAIALGARMVLVGRPFNYAAAVGAQAGVEHAIELLVAEIDRNLAMLGVRSPKLLNHEYLTEHLVAPRTTTT